MALGHKAIVVINKIDRPDAVIDDVVNRTFDLFVHLGATDEQLDFPIVYTSAIKGIATLDVNKPGTDIAPLAGYRSGADPCSGHQRQRAAPNSRARPSP